ncbi:MAG: ABC transporter ATP-binding protein [Bdellovibrionota bacterium]
MVLELQNAWKTYHMGEVSLDVLKGVSVQINPGEFVAIVGPSGSGKSTLMNLIGLLDSPTKGKIYVEGSDITTLTESELAQFRGKTIGFIFQQFNLIATLTALENVMLPMVFQGTPQEARIQRATELLTNVGLGERLDHKPGQLSGGQQQRVAIARSLVNNPAIILADEPTGNLDSHSGIQVMEILSSLHKKDHKTIVLVTHDPRLVEFADRVIHVKDGLIEKVTKK